MLLWINDKKCMYCRILFNSDTDKTKDHIIPISKGGLNTASNIVPCCKDCNSFKDDYLPKEWRDKIIFLLNNPQKIRFPYDLKRISTVGRQLIIIEKYCKQNFKQISKYSYNG